MCNCCWCSIFFQLLVFIDFLECDPSFCFLISYMHLFSALGFGSCVCFLVFRLGTIFHQTASWSPLPPSICHVNDTSLSSLLSRPTPFNHVTSPPSPCPSFVFFSTAFSAIRICILIIHSGLWNPSSQVTLCEGGTWGHEGDAVVMALVSF